MYQNGVKDGIGGYNMQYTAYIGYTSHSACVMLASNDNLDDWGYKTCNYPSNRVVVNNDLIKISMYCLVKWLSAKGDCESVCVYMKADNISSAMETLRVVDAGITYEVNFVDIDKSTVDETVEMLEWLLAKPVSA